MADQDKKKLLTLCVIHQHPRILLGMKKRGIGMGKWNGFGGKVMPGETIKAAARRELKEEAGIDADGMNKVGIIDFKFKDNPEIWQVHIFKAVNFSGDPIESDEMRPQWFHVDDVPLHEMWPDDKYWLPLLLSDKKFKGRVDFGEDDVIVAQNITTVHKI